MVEVAGIRRQRGLLHPMSSRATSGGLPLAVAHFLAPTHYLFVGGEQAPAGKIAPAMVDDIYG